jgi:Winged helix-turn helix
MLNIHDLKAAYEKAIGHPTSDSTVYNLLHRHGWRKLMPRPFHPKRDFAAQNAFKKTAFLMLPDVKGTKPAIKRERRPHPCRKSKPVAIRRDIGSFNPRWFKLRSVSDH